MASPEDRREERRRFDEKSHDSILSTVLARLDAQDKTTDSNAYLVSRHMEKLTDQIIDLNHRMTKTERFCWACGGGLLVLSTLATIIASMGGLHFH